jgi:hypothetical protein
LEWFFLTKEVKLNDLRVNPCPKVQGQDGNTKCNESIGLDTSITIQFRVKKENFDQQGKRNQG